MQAIVVGSQGPVLAQRPVPQPGPSEVLVRIHSAALNRADLHVAAGHRHGRSGGEGSIIGIEWAGEVVEVGTEVPAGHFRSGDAVMCSGTGGYAQYAVTDWGRVYKLPAGWEDFSRAATLPVALQTAHEALTASGAMRQGQEVLVHGASSGVGLMTLQVAKLLGAKQVIGTSTNAARREELSKFGAHHAVDASVNDWSEQVLEHTHGQGVDLVIDFVAGATVAQTMRATRIGGRIVNVGRMGGFTGEFDFDLHSLRRLHYVGATFRTRSVHEVREIAQSMQRGVWQAVADGRLSLPLARVFPLQQAVQALDYLRSNAHFGKVVLAVS